MKVCKKCGYESTDEAKFCTNCGCELSDCTAKAEEASAPAETDAVQAVTVQESTVPTVPVQETAAQDNTSGLKTAAKVLMIVGTVSTSMCCFLIPLAWCIPMTIHYFKAVNKGEPVSTAFKVCSLLFVSMVGGILMLCDKD